MVVEHIVVRCCKCSLFQVTQKKKVNKFNCKVCGEKQSLRKLYAQSYKAADLRPLVQQYNLTEGKFAEEEEEKKRNNPVINCNQDEVDNYLQLLDNNKEPQKKQKSAPSHEKWKDFQWNEDEETFEKYSDKEDNPQYSLERPTTSRKRTNSNKRNQSKQPTKKFKSNHSTEFEFQDNTDVVPRKSKTTTKATTNSTTHSTLSKPTSSTTRLPTSSDATNVANKSQTSTSLAKVLNVKKPVASVWDKFKYSGDSEEEEEFE